MPAMTDGQWLFTVFAVLYLLECVRWLPGGTVGLTGAGDSWRAKLPLAQVQWAGLKPLLFPILPPPELHLVTLPWLIVPCGEGVEVCGNHEAIPVLIAWDELAPQVDGAHLHLAEGLRLRLPDERLAQEWQQRLRAWREMNDEARTKDFLKFARQTLDSKTLDKTATRLSQHTRGLRWLAATIFVWTFGVVTGIYRWFGESVEVLIAAGLLFVLLWAQAFVFWRSAKRAQPGLTHRFWKALAIAFMPQHAMRAADLLCRAEPISAHPLAARKLLSDEAWKQLAGRYWKAVQHGQAKSAALQCQALEACFKLHGIDTKDLEPAPVRENGSAAYCPRCLAQFSKADAICRDCGGLALREWPSETR